MYNRYRAILVDADVDFILDDHYDWIQEPGCHRDAQLTMSGWKYGHMLRQFMKPTTKVRLVVDHHESLYHWDIEEIENALCIHIDAHHDLWKNNIDRSKGPKSNREFIDCGSYLQQALYDGIVGKVLYIPSVWRWITEEREDIDRQLPGRLRHKVAVRSLDHFLKQLPLIPKADVITVAISPNYTPRQFEPEIVDLCRALRINSRVITQKLRKANKDWNQLYATNWCDGFQFPYKGSGLREISK